MAKRRASKQSYSDCVPFLDKANAEGKAELTFADEARATQFRARCYALRTILREESERVYEPWDNAYGRTPYDSLRLLKEGRKIIILKTEDPLGLVEAT